MIIEVYFDGGICVEVPDTTDVESKEGYDLIDSIAREKLLEYLKTGQGSFTVSIKPEPF